MLNDRRKFLDYLCNKEVVGWEHLLIYDPEEDTVGIHEVFSKDKTFGWTENPVSIGDCYSPDMFSKVITEIYTKMIKGLVFTEEELREYQDEE